VPLYWPPRTCRGTRTLRIARRLSASGRLTGGTRHRLTGALIHGLRRPRRASLSCRRRSRRVWPGPRRNGITCVAPQGWLRGRRKNGFRFRCACGTRRGGSSGGPSGLLTWSGNLRSRSCRFRARRSRRNSRLSCRRWRCSRRGRAGFCRDRWYRRGHTTGSRFFSKGSARGLNWRLGRGNRRGSRDCRCCGTGSRSLDRRFLGGLLCGNRSGFG
jgi:hypothetical protein